MRDWLIKIIMQLILIQKKKAACGVLRAIITVTIMLVVIPYLHKLGKKLTHFEDAKSWRRTLKNTKLTI